MTMKKLALLSVFLALPLLLSAQTAKVIQLSPDEAKEAQAIQQAKKDLQAREDALREKIAVAHLVTPNGGESDCQDANYKYKPGWNCGKFEYSEDFRFIVPKSVRGIAPCGGNSPFCSNWNWITPAYGADTVTTIPLNTGNDLVYRR